MSTPRPCRIVLICPEGARLEGASIASALTERLEDNTPSFFSRPVAVIGSDAITEWAAATRAEPSTLELLPALAARLGGLWCCTQHPDPDYPTTGDVEAWLAEHGRRFADDLETP